MSTKITRTDLGSHVIEIRELEGTGLARGTVITASGIVVFDEYASSKREAEDLVSEYFEAKHGE